MEINDFSAVIELIATISVAFVAVEYVKSYTNILCERFFNFNYDVIRFLCASVKNPLGTCSNCFYFCTDYHCHYNDFKTFFGR